MKRAAAVLATGLLATFTALLASAAGTARPATPLGRTRDVRATVQDSAPDARLPPGRFDGLAQRMAADVGPADAHSHHEGGAKGDADGPGPMEETRYCPDQEKDDGAERGRHAPQAAALWIAQLGDDRGKGRLLMS